MTTTIILTIVGLVLSSNLITAIIVKILSRPSDKAGIIKLRNESGQMVLEGELKLTGFYKDQLETIIEKYSLLEKKLDDKTREYTACQEQVELLEEKCNDLQIQITRLSTRMDNRD